MLFSVIHNTLWIHVPTCCSVSDLAFWGFLFTIFLSLLPSFNSSEARKSKPLEEMVRCHKETGVLQLICVHFKT